MGCSLNLLPMLLPAAAFCGEGTADLTVLAAVGLVGSAAYAAGACVERERRQAGGGRKGSDEQPVLPAEEDGAR